VVRQDPCVPAQRYFETGFPHGPSQFISTAGGNRPDVCARLEIWAYVKGELLKQADVHTLLRLPTGIFYAQGVKANVVFFDRKPAREKPWTETLWIYDLRTNQPFTLEENPLNRADLDDFVAGYNVKNRHERRATERFKPFTYAELTKRDKINLDIFWLKDESLEDSANLPDPHVIKRKQLACVSLGATPNGWRSNASPRKRPARPSFRRVPWSSSFGASRWRVMLGRCQGAGTGRQVPRHAACDGDTPA
jgi:hypothetical protein